MKNRRTCREPTVARCDVFSLQSRANKKRASASPQREVVASSSPFRRAASSCISLELGRKRIVKTLLVFEDERIEIYEGPIRSGTRSATPLMTHPPAQNDILAFFRAYEVHDIGDVCVKVNMGRQQVDAVTGACERRRKRFVPLRQKRTSYSLPAPTAMPCAVHQGASISVANCTRLEGSCSASRHTISSTLDYGTKGCGLRATRSRRSPESRSNAARRLPS